MNAMKPNKRKIPKIERHDHPGQPGGLARTHRIVRTEQLREIQFQKLCSQIRLENFRKCRSDQQREDRKIKRG